MAAEAPTKWFVALDEKGSVRVPFAVGKHDCVGDVATHAAKALGLGEVSQLALSLFRLSMAGAKPTKQECQDAARSEPFDNIADVSVLPNNAWLLLVDKVAAAASAEAQAFLNAARAQADVRSRIVAGSILSVPVLNKTTSIYIRRCFQPLLWDVLSVHKMKTDSVGDTLTGTPGAGKSTLAVLAVYVALSEGRDVAFWNGQKSVGHVFSGDKATTFDDHPSFLRAARRDVKNGGLFVYDTYPPPEFRGAQTLLVSSPKVHIWKEFAKFGDATEESEASLLVFPTCSREEIRGMAPLFSHRVPTWEVAHEHLGGVPRHVFRSFDPAAFARSSIPLLQSVERAFEFGIERSLGEAECKVPDMYVHFRTLGQASEAGQVDEAEACNDMSNPRYFTPYDVAYASPKAQEVIEKAAETLSEESLAEALKHGVVLRQLAGGRLERLVHGHTVGEKRGPEVPAEQAGSAGKKPRP